MANTDTMKKNAALKALDYIQPGMIVGVGTGSTANYFIEALSSIKHTIDGTVASSIETANRLKAHNIPVFELNTVNTVHVYIDGADEFNPYRSLIKGGGGALTREKIIAAAAQQFICIVDQTKQVDILGKFPLPIEVHPMARSYVAREMVKIGGQPEYREGFITDNQNIILDIYNLSIQEPIAMETKINCIPGVITNGIFAITSADIILMGTKNGVEIVE